jgi:hypothetical protein
MRKSIEFERVRNNKVRRDAPEKPVKIWARRRTSYFVRGPGKKKNRKENKPLKEKRENVKKAAGPGGENPFLMAGVAGLHPIGDLTLENCYTQ